ncbi:MAG TPA: hypothetical protein VKY74_22700 [Chloroflexia bacterium]|nr:hypothetical protein [Chloroflexia bacterium]
MITPLAPPRPAPAGPAAPQSPPAGAPAVPGRDLALFLLLLCATDFSGLLHIYGLSWLYGEPLFLGLGWTMVLIAVGLLILPAQGPPAWLPLRRLASVLALFVLVVLITLAASTLLLALSNPPAWVGRDPHADTSPVGLLSTLGLQLGALAAVPLGAFAIGYTRQEATRRAWIALLAVAGFTLSLVNLLYDAHVGKHAPETWAIVLGLGLPTTIGLGGLIAAAGGLVLLRPARFLAATIGAGLALRVAGLALIPLTIRLGDMLPLIGLSTARLLHGQNPYIVYHLPWELPLTYWPLTVLSYLPAAGLGLDLRWINLLCGPGVALLLLWAGGRRGPGPAAYAYGLLYLTPTMLQWDLSTAAPPYWLWLCGAFAAAVVAGRGRAGTLLAGAAAGAALAAAPLALPFLPFLGGAWLLPGWRPALRRTLVAAVTLLLVVGPFLLWDPAGFWNGAVSWFNDLARLPLLKWQTDRSWAFEIGLAGPIWQAGQQAWLKPLQALLLGGLLLASLLWRPRPLRTPGGALRWGAAAYLLFMVVNPVIWPYLYTPALLALVFAQLPAAAETRLVIHEGHEDHEDHEDREDHAGIAGPVPLTRAIGGQ